MITQAQPRTEKISGNVVPNCWYKIFKTCDKPDLIAITILSEILFKYRIGEIPNGRWRVSYGYFENKFEFSKNQIRSAFTRLEEYKVVAREIVTEVLNSRKYGGVLYLLFNYKNLQAIQEKICAPLKQNAHPPCEKSEPNKSFNNIKLNSNDVEKINLANLSKYTLEHCNNVLDQVKARYPNLMFASKSSLLNYLRKALKTFSSFKSSFPLKTDTGVLHSFITKSAYDFNQNMNAKIEAIIPQDICTKVVNSFVLLESQNDSFVIKVLCNKSLVSPYENALHKAASEILLTSSISFEYLENDSTSLKDLFEALKLKLCFMYGAPMYFSWFNKLNFGSLLKGEWTLFASSQFIRDWIYEHCGDTILSCLQSIDLNAKSLEIHFQNSLDK